MPYSKPNARTIASQSFCFNGSLNERITGIGSASLVNHSGVVGRHLPCTILSKLRAMGTQFNRGEKKPDSINRGNNNLDIAEFRNFSNVKDSKILQKDRNLGECEARSIHDNNCIWMAIVGANECTRSVVPTEKSYCAILESRSFFDEDIRY